METKKEQQAAYDAKAIVCRCGEAYSMMTRLPEADTDPKYIKEFQEYESEGRVIKYITNEEHIWHSPAACLKNLQKYKTACESINPDNPLAVAESLKEMYQQLHEIVFHELLEPEALKPIKELLTKIQ